MAYMPPSTIEQIRCLPNWAPEKRTELFETIVPSLGGVAWRLGIRESMMDDVVQETVTQVFVCAERYSAEYPLKPWVFQIMRHVVFGVFRNGRRAISLEEAPTVDRQFDSIWRKEIAEQAETRLKAKNCKQMAVAIDVLIDGLSTKDAMKKHNVTENYVHTAKSRARKALADLELNLDD